MARRILRYRPICPRDFAANDVALALERKLQDPVRRDGIDAVETVTNLVGEKRPVLFQLLPLALQKKLTRMSARREAHGIEFLEKLVVTRFVPARIPVDKKARAETIQP